MNKNDFNEVELAALMREHFDNLAEKSDEYKDAVINTTIERLAKLAAPGLDCTVDALADYLKEPIPSGISADKEEAVRQLLSKEAALRKKEKLLRTDKVISKTLLLTSIGTLFTAFGIPSILNLIENGLSAKDCWGIGITIVLSIILCVLKKPIFGFDKTREE